jgi:predicted SAM-dependent methyltransferase
LSELRLNVGCGMFRIDGYVNIDCDAASTADLFAEVPPLPYHDCTVDEIYAGHFLEHLDPEEAAHFLKECYRVLKPGCKLGIVVPDIREVMARWFYQINDRFQVPERVWWDVRDLDHICNVFLYNSIFGNVERPHKWCYEPKTLKRAMEQFGFVNLTPIDGYLDERLAAPSWFNCGFDGYKPA